MRAGARGLGAAGAPCSFPPFRLYLGQPCQRFNSLTHRKAEYTCGRGNPLSDLVQVVDSRGRRLTPCRRQIAEREVRLQRAKWVGENRIRLRFDPFAYRYVRLKVLARDNHVCYWCGGFGNTIDHIIPWSRGGRTTMTNCVTACQECNSQRGDTPAEVFARQKGVAVPRFTGNEEVPRPLVRRAPAAAHRAGPAGAPAAAAASRTARAAVPQAAPAVPQAAPAAVPRAPLAPLPDLTPAQRAERVLRLARLLEGGLTRRQFL